MHAMCVHVCVSVYCMCLYRCLVLLVVHRSCSDPDLFPDGVPFALCAVFQNSDLVRFLLQFV